MKSLYWSTIMMLAAPSVWAGAPPVDPEPMPMPMADGGSSGDATGAIVLLALTAMVIAVGTLAPAASQNKNSLDIDESGVDDNAGF